MNGRGYLRNPPFGGWPLPVCNVVHCVASHVTRYHTVLLRRGCFAHVDSGARLVRWGVVNYWYLLMFCQRWCEAVGQGGMYNFWSNCAPRKAWNHWLMLVLQLCVECLKFRRLMSLGPATVCLHFGMTNGYFHNSMRSTMIQPNHNHELGINQPLGYLIQLGFHPANVRMPNRLRCRQPGPTDPECKTWWIYFYGPNPIT